MVRVMRRWDPMIILAAAVFIGVVGMSAASLLRSDSGLTAEETALLAAIVGAVAGASLPRSASGEDKDVVPTVVGSGDAVDQAVYDTDGAHDVSVDPGLDGDEPDYGDEAGDWFDDFAEPEEKRS